MDMTTNRTSQVIRHLRKAMLLQDGAGMTDGQLLGRFIEHRDEAAFAALVKRHGPMVWGVCRRLLPHHDAEDAFQATFLVLVRKAASVLPREMVANWLYGVARQTALHSRRTTARRGARERQVTPMPEPAVAEQHLWHDLQPLLDQELARLPDKYRVAIILCNLEGKTRKEAARQLGCPEGTLAARLARGRVMLAKRFARHGLAVSGGAMAAALSQQVASAAVPPSVVYSTINAATSVAAGPAAGVISVNAAALTERVLKTMLLHKLKLAAVVLLLALVCLGVGVRSFTASAAGQPEPPKAAGATDGKPVEKGHGNALALAAILEQVDADRQTITARTIRAWQWMPMITVTEALAGKEVKIDRKSYRSLVIEGKKAKIDAARVSVQDTSEGGDVKNLEDRTANQPTKLANLPLGKDAKIVKGGKEIKLTDLKAGMRVRLELAVDRGGLVVMGIRADDKEGERTKQQEKKP
jgi:RNA polymerase sigma factor (sigma-70 family)